MPGSVLELGMEWPRFPGLLTLLVYIVMEERDRKSTRQRWMMMIMMGRYIDTSG